MRKVELTSTQAALAELLGQLTEVARRAGLPAEWQICPCCGEHSWVLAPHDGACPLNVAIAEQFGMKLDAERMAAIRTGVSMDTMSKGLLDRLLPPQDEDEHES